MTPVFGFFKKLNPKSTLDFFHADFADFLDSQRSLKKEKPSKSIYPESFVSCDTFKNRTQMTQILQIYTNEIS